MQTQAKAILSKLLEENYFETGDYWKKASEAFRIFWNTKIMNNEIKDFADREWDDLDPIIRLLDVNGTRYYSYTDAADKEKLRQRLIASGKQYGCEYIFEEKHPKNRNWLCIMNAPGAVRAIIPQDKWYLIFKELKSKRDLREKLDEIFKSAEPAETARLLNELKEINNNDKNFLTKPAAIAISTILSIQNPDRFSQVVSLYHKKLIIKAFDLGDYDDEKEDYGNKIIKTNDLVFGINKKLNSNLSGFDLSSFLYQKEVRQIWENGIEPPKKETNYFVLQTGSDNYDDKPSTQYHFSQGIPGSAQLLASKNKGKFVYYEKGKFYGKGEIGNITSKDENGTTQYFVDIQKYEPIESTEFNTIKAKLSFNTIGQAGIRKILEKDYQAIVEVNLPESNFFDKELDIKITDLSFGDLIFEDSDRLKTQIYSALKSGKHLMFLGPPGTGKTEIAKVICQSLKEKTCCTDFAITTATSDWTTFDTIGGYSLSKDSSNLEFMPGLFLQCFLEKGKPVSKWLVIDEINRSDIDKAFGQLFTVLSGQRVELSFQNNDGNISIAPAKRRQDSKSNEFVVPKSWRLMATLNTYDKAALYQMSYAFMRRFAFIYVSVPSSSFVDANWNEYLKAWKTPETESLKTVANDLKEVWKVLNEKGSKRPIGPATQNVGGLNSEFVPKNILSIW